MYLGPGFEGRDASLALVETGHNFLLLRKYFRAVHSSLILTTVLSSEGIVKGLIQAGI